MSKYNSKNERIKRDYFRFQTQANQKSVLTLNGVRKAIDRFEQYLGYKDFATFNKEQAIAFKKHIAKIRAVRTGEPISKSTILSTTNNLKEFFRWMAWQPGYKSKIHVPDIEYFNLSEKEISIAKAARLKDYPTIDQVRAVIFSMPTDDIIQRRNRALIAFAILTGMRDSALGSLRMKHVNLSKEPVMILQEPDQIKTKFSKLIFSHFLPIGADIKSVAVAWVLELREKMNFGQNDPIFPRTLLAHDVNNSFTAQGLDRVCWTTATPIRKIFKEAFLKVKLPYFSPHRFRDTLVHLGQELCQTPEEFKAWSQSLGHSSPLTTFTSYGQIDPHRQGKILGGLKIKQMTSNDKKEILKEFSEFLNAK